MLKQKLVIATCARKQEVLVMDAFSYSTKIFAEETSFD